MIAGTSPLADPEVLAAIDRAVARVAPTSHQHGNQHDDDVRQEARIGAWKALLKYGDQFNPALAHTSARWAAISAVKSSTILDQRKQDARRPVSLEWLADQGLNLSSAPDTLSPELAADFDRVLASLEPWEATFLRAYLAGQRTLEEACRDAGVTKARGQTRWYRVLQPLLRSRLAEYAPAVG